MQACSKMLLSVVGSFKAGETIARFVSRAQVIFASGPNAREYAVPRMHAIARFAEAVAGC